MGILLDTEDIMVIKRNKLLTLMVLTVWWGKRSYVKWSFNLLLNSSLLRDHQISLNSWPWEPNAKGRGTCLFVQLKFIEILPTFPGTHLLSSFRSVVSNCKKLRLSTWGHFGGKLRWPELGSQHSQRQTSDSDSQQLEDRPQPPCFLSEIILKGSIHISSPGDP